MKKRILFIDDEDLVLQSLKRVLYSMNQEWEMEFVDSGAKALALMAEKPFDVVISDMLMPGMSGVQLLETVRNRYPATARFILSGHAPGEEVFNCIASSDHFFAKPANVDAIKSAVQGIPEMEASLTELHRSVKAEIKGGGRSGQLKKNSDSEEVSRIIRSIKT